jgi:metal-responsive CopG/Arc/MetJ family transcriptional regulator
MKDQDKTREERKPFAGTNLIREVSYLHADEAAALAKRAEQKRVSKSEVIRQAIRAYLGIED